MMNVLNVYIPEKLKTVKQGFLRGTYFKGEYGSIKEPGMIVIDNSVENEFSQDCIGRISTSFDTDSFRKSVFIIINNEPFSICVFINNYKVYLEDLNIIYYNPSQIEKSCILSNPNLHNAYFSKSIEHFIQRVKRKEVADEKYKNVTPFGVYYMISLYVSFTSNIIKALDSVNEFLMKRFSVKSCSLQQLSHRLQQINYLTFNIIEKKLVVKRLIGVLLFDILLGIGCFIVISQWTSSFELHHYFQVTTKGIATKVQELLNWLSGAPAGLKLNQPLSETLASFFSYHVYLWTMYVGVASPLLQVMTKLFVSIGLFGVSLQIALLADFLSLGLIHIHTFYIYAARLHMLQVSLLGSQWRGFRGRKWNPLKEREDSRSEHRQRPLIKAFSAFGFTFVLFLMPTTTVYYCVFVVLRVLLLSIQGLFSLFLWALNSNPIYILVLHVFGSQHLKGNLHFELLTNEDQNLESPLELRLTVKSSSITDSVKSSYCSTLFPSMPKLDFAYICNSLIYADKLL
ncbi:UNVERIFIED_CONTAM: hypothetical protein RMT77_016852 [Armadillidium vulgare]